MADPNFKNRKDWDRHHLRCCPYLFRDEARSSLSRMFFCGWWIAGRRCTFKWCPLVDSDGD